MFSLIRKMCQWVLSFDAEHEKLLDIEERLTTLENISDERESLWLFIEEVREQEQQSSQLLQEELSEVLVRSLEPRGEA